MRARVIAVVTAITCTACGGEADDTTAADGTESSAAASEDTTGDNSDTGGGESGDTAGDTTGDTAGDGDGDVDFTLTSTDFEMGGIIPTLHHFQGGNVSPALAWVGAPEGTLSFGVYFHDLDFQPQGFPYRHSAIWNISADATELPQGVEMAAMPSNVPGASQCLNWFGEYGYGGPGSESNTYEFILYALDVASLSEVDASSNLAQVQAALDAHAIEVTTLSGQTEGPPP